MSSQYLNQNSKNGNVNIRINDSQIDNDLTVGRASSFNHSTFNGDIFKTSATNQQLTLPTTSIDANFKNRLIINTQIFTTPHSTNNSTSFIVNNFECSGNDKVVRVDIQQYLGTGLPIVTGRCSASGNLYEITIINIHPSQDLNSTFRLSLELEEFV